MKDQFQGFYRPTEEEFEKLWENAVFVFDTNVLLNLYRYQKETSEKLLGILNSVKNRIWIPYHVGLEFHRNRLSVIADQNKKFKELNDKIDSAFSSLEGQIGSMDLKRRHSTINVDGFIDEFKKVKDDFIKELSELEEGHLGVNDSDDPVLNELLALFEGNIGQRPDSQTWVDEQQKEAKKRKDNKIPPGYMDDDKEKSKYPAFFYDGLLYQRAYSDYIIWKQIIDHAKAEDVNSVIFVVDDNKEDWWYKINQNGEKTISPRPELIQEIVAESSLDGFYMYSYDRFLTHANDYLSANISTEILDEVKLQSKKSVAMSEHDALKSVTYWYIHNYDATSVDSGFKQDAGIDLKVSTRYSGRIGVNVENISHNHIPESIEGFRQRQKDSLETIVGNGIDSLHLVLIVTDALNLTEVDKKGMLSFLKKENDLILNSNSKIIAVMREGNFNLVKIV